MDYRYNKGAFSGLSQRLRQGTDDDPTSRPGSVLSVLLSIEPGRSRHRGIAKAANRAIHLIFPASCRDFDPYLGA